jgi:hypothetical protein
MATTQVLPRELRLTAPPTMPQARSYLFKQQSSNASYDPTVSSTIQINIPRLQRSYLTKDSYLRFRMSLTKAFPSTTGQQIAFDTPGALSLIDKIEIYDYLGSTLLESTSGHGQLTALLMDLNLNPVESGLHYATTMGMRSGAVVADQDSFASTFTETGASYTVGGVFTVTDSTKYKIGQPISITAQTAGSLTVNQVYYVSTIPSGTTLTVSATQGGSPITVVTTAGTAVAIASNVAGSDSISSTSYPRSGAVLQANNGYAIAATDFFEYAVPLFSFLGNNSSKFVPLHNGFTIMITLNQIAAAFGATNVDGTLATGMDATTSFKLDNVYYCCQVLELGPAAESMLMSSSEGKPLVIPSKAFRNFVSNVPAASSNFRLDLNLNVASMTNLLWIMRPSETNTTGGGVSVASQNMKSLSTRVRNFLQSWYFQYGSSILPQTQGIQCGPLSGSNVRNGGHDEAYLELLKARHALNSESFDTMIDSESFQRDVAAVGSDACRPSVLSNKTTAPSGKFACGLDLELIPGRSQSLVCGMNTNGMNTSIYGTFDPNQNTKVGACRVDAWCEYDSFINISPGIATTVSF